MAAAVTPHSLFIADLHLCVSRPETIRLFLDFLKRTAVHADALYILGDLFEYWLGDDTLHLPLHASICQAIRQVAEVGVKVYFMHGNRDFLLAEQFAQACQASLLTDPTLVNLYGTDTLLMHGDTLCTDDVDYLAFRQQVRNPAWQTQFLAQPLASRAALAQQARSQSESAKQEKSIAIMNVNDQAVMTVLRQYHYPRLIHGHTHRTALHSITIDGHTCQRWVLTDWHDHGGYLRCSADNCQFVTIKL